MGSPSLFIGNGAFNKQKQRGLPPGQLLRRSGRWLCLMRRKGISYPAHKNSPPQESSCEGEFTYFLNMGISDYTAVSPI